MPRGELAVAVFVALAVIFIVVIGIHRRHPTPQPITLTLETSGAATGRIIIQNADPRDVSWSGEGVRITLTTPDAPSGANKHTLK